MGMMVVKTVGAHFVRPVLRQAEPRSAMTISPIINVPPESLRAHAVRPDGDFFRGGCRLVSPARGVCIGCSVRWELPARGEPTSA